MSPHRPAARWLAGTAACALAGAALLSAGPAVAGSCPRDPAAVLAPATPEEAGLAPAALARLVADLRQKDRDLHGLVVSRSCRIVLELYARDVGREHNHAVYSVTKSVLATLVGALLGAGRLRSVDVPVASLMARPAEVPPLDWRKLEWIELAHVLAMASGLDYRHDPRTNSVYGAGDRLAHAIVPPVAHDPGTRFRYSDGDASIAGAVVAAIAGSDLATLAEEVLFWPLGFENFDWWFADEAGRLPGGWGMRLRVVDMVRLGYLWLDGGVWQGRRLFPAAWRDRAWRAGTVERYGLFWWRNGEHAETLGTVHAAVGFKGQRVLVVPRHGLVVAYTANLSPPEETAADQIVLKGLASALEPAGESDAAQGRKALAEQAARPFTGRPGTPVRDQDVPRLPATPLAGQR